MNCHCTTSSFTLPPEPSGLRYLVLARPSGWAFYDVSVRRLAVLRSDFLQTTPRGVALAVG